MALEIRGNKKYYYRSRRVNGRVIKEYVAKGEAAEEAARLDAEARLRRAEERIAHATECEALFARVRKLLRDDRQRLKRSRRKDPIIADADVLRQIDDLPGNSTAI